MKLQRDFYERANVVQVAKEVLGKHVHTHIGDQHVVGIITEVEAYAGQNDKACHANNGLRSKRTEVMYGRGGFSYVYLCYGIHHLFNIVTNVQGSADAILVRAIEPLSGHETMLGRRGMTSLQKKLSSGPGTLTKALGINKKEHYGLDLAGDQIWLEDAPLVRENNLVTTTRIGVDYAEEDALKPWRFYIRDSQWVSKK